MLSLSSRAAGVPVKAAEEEAEVEGISASVERVEQIAWVPVEGVEVDREVVDREGVEGDGEVEENGDEEEEGGVAEVFSGTIIEWLVSDSTPGTCCPQKGVAYRSQGQRK
jgi:hypothetical protein